MSKPAQPVLVTLLALAQIIMGGLLLLFCGTFGLGNTVVGSSSATVTITRGGQSTTMDYDVREEMEKQAPGYNLTMLGSGIADVVLHAAMIVGAIGMLRLRAWGWWLSLAWVVFRIGYQIGILCYVWYVAQPAANAVVHAVPHDDAGVCGSLVNGNSFYHAGWGLFSLVFSLYPLVMLVLLLLPVVWRPLLTVSEESDEEEAGRRRRDRDERRTRRERDDY